MGPIITLLTDYGTGDGYVAAMKGVILDLCPHSTVVDAGHDVPRHDVAAGAWALAQYAHHYPIGTIHVAVVDPALAANVRVLSRAAAARFSWPRTTGCSRG